MQTNPRHRRRHAAALAVVAVVAIGVGSGVGATTVPPTSEPPTAESSDGGGDTGITTVAVEMTADGCPAPEGPYDSGPFTFEVENVSAAGVTEFEVLAGDRILAEKENLPPGFGGSFSIELGPGTYTLYCPGASTERTDLVVTGEELEAAPTDTGEMLQQGADDYLGYVRTQVVELADAVVVLDDAIQSGDVEASQLAYIQARPFYERIEPVAESFVLDGRNLDAAIDLRADDVEPTELEGFHRIEYGLWVDGSTDGLGEVSTQLVADVGQLGGLVDGLDSLQAYDLANGAVGLLDEAAGGKITGEEERYSRIDVLDMAANVEGSQQAFAYLETGLTEIDPDLVATIKERFTALQDEVDTLVDPDQPSGYVLYEDLTDEQITGLSDALQAVAEPLSQVAEKVVNA
ncbi:MAG: iron uptake system protein EfeO [Desertimonas sp.]